MAPPGTSAADRGKTVQEELDRLRNRMRADRMQSDREQAEVIAAKEALLEITGDDLVRLAWHIGNRHCPCQLEPARLLIQNDHVIRDMLTKLGATLRDVSEPFIPEGGAYGHGRTHSHAH